ncbi:thiamine phosphate synthase [Pyruvatibacter mobilis]|uniref:thiamine phosphate synthase n=1 Tax=Pyruvatibacter mobilis TaxID=1712261 RepID=UPI003D139170
MTPPRLDDVAAFSRVFEAALKAGDVACVQLRLKDVPDDEVIEAATALIPIAHDYDVAFLINDRPDIAKKVGADGVHIGQDDAPYSEARKLLGPDAIIGVTCHDSRHLAMKAGEQGADYVAFGAFYDTATKQAPTRAAPEILSWWQQLFEVPCVAIGGITVENAAPLVAAGADFLAVSSGVWSYPSDEGGPAQAVKAIDEVIAATPMSLLEFDA